MTLDEIRNLNAYQLAGRLGIAQPDSRESAGAMQLCAVRDWYIEHRDEIREAPGKVIRERGGETGPDRGGPVFFESDAQWRVFTDLGLWQEDFDVRFNFSALEWGNLDGLAATATGATSRALLLWLHTYDNGTAGDDSL